MAIVFYTAALAGDMLRAAESQVWELEPYRIQVLLVPDWPLNWSQQRLVDMSRSVALRAQVEIGRRWQLGVRAVPMPIRRAVLAAGKPTDLKDYGERLGSYRDSNKVVLILLRVESSGYSAVAWELDWAADRWSEGRRFLARDEAGLQGALFEAVDSVVAPVGLVKLASGQRVVLRPRGALLPIRNHRRVAVKIGSVFEVLRRERPSSNTDARDVVLVVAEEVDGRGVVCRVVSHRDNPIEGTPLEQWIAVQARVNHATTRFCFTKGHADATQPLTECEIWNASTRADRGTLIGCLNAAGEIDLTATGTAQWLKVKVGAVIVREYCVVAGVRCHQTIDTRLGNAELTHAGTLAISCDDVAELLAVREIYMARHQHRLEKKRDEEAAAVLKELQELLERRIPQLLDTIQQRRDRIAAEHPDETNRFRTQWHELADRLKGVQ